MLAIQSGWLALYFSGKDLPVPGFLKNYISEYASENGFAFTAERAYVGLDGRIVLIGVSAGFLDGNNTVFRAERLEIGIDIAKLASATFRPNLLLLKNAALYGGNNEKAAVEKINALIIRRRGNFILKRASANMGALKVRMGAIVPKSFDAGSLGFLPSGGGKAAAGAGKAESLSRRWDSACEKIAGAANLFDGFDSPVLELSIDASPDARTFAEAVFTAEKYKGLLKENPVVLSRPRVDLKLDKPGADYARVVMRVEKLTAAIPGEKLEVGCSEFSALLEVKSFKKRLSAGGFSARQAALSADTLKASKLGIKNLSASKDTLSAADATDGWRIFFRHGDGSFEADLRGNSERLQVQFDSRADFNALIRHPSLSHVKELRGTSFNGPVHISGICDIFPPRGEGNMQAKIRADMFAQDCSFLGIPVEEMSSKLSFDTEDKVFRADGASIKTREGWLIGGDVFQNISDGTYSFALKGGIMPMRIAGIMAPWWTRIFKTTRFEKSAPEADVFVEGRWGHPEYIWCFAKAVGDDVEYGGSLFKSFSAFVLVNPRLIALLDADIQNGESRAKFDLQWLYGKNGITHFEKNTLNGSFELTQSEIISLAGSEVEEIFKVISFADRPSAEVNALLFNPKDANAPEDMYEARINSHGKMCLDAVDFDNASFFAFAQGGLIDAGEIEAQTCHGEIFGSARVTDVYDKEKASLHLSLNCQDLNVGEFLETLSDIGKTPEQILEENAQDARDRLNNQNAKGAKGAFAGAEDAKLSGSMTLSGPLFDPSGLSGNGNAVVQSPQLGKLNLLGAISRTLGRFGANMGTFDVTDASAECSVGEGSVEFKNLEITGPKIKISGLANYEFINGDIKGRLLISPFGSMDTPVLSRIFAAIDPFMSVFEVFLSGKIEDPAIGVTIRPLNIFNSEEKLLESFDKEMRQSDEGKESNEVKKATPEGESSGENEEN